MTKLGLYIVLLLSISLKINAQFNLTNLDPFYINYTTDDGLPSSECHHTIQDQKGYIWIATDNGVSKFDGYGFQNFSAEDGLKNNVVFYLQEDSDGKIWMLTMSGNLYYYDYQTNSIHPFKFNHKILQYQKEYDWAGPFYVDSSNTVYIGLKNFGVIRIKENGQVFIFQSKEMASLVISEIEDYLIFSKTSCSIHEIEDCLKKYTQNQITGSWEFYKDTVLVRTVYPKREDLELLNTVSSRIKGASDFCKRLKNGQILGQYDYSNYLFEKNYSYSQKNNLFIISSEKTILEFPNGSILMGELNPGAVYEFEGLDQFMNNEVKSKFLKGKQISSIQLDRDHGVWITTTKSGLFYLPNYNKRNNNTLLTGSNIGGFLIENNQTIFIGDGKSNIYKYNLEKYSFSPLREHQRAGPVRAIYRDKNNNFLWVASGNLSWLDNGKWNNVIKSENGGNHFQIGLSKSFNPSQNQKFLWTWNHSTFFKIDMDTKSVILDGEKLGIRTQIKSIFEDYNHQIWVGTMQGLFGFRDTTLIPQDQHPAFQVRVEEIRQMRDSTLIIGTKGAGVVFWKNEEMIQVTKENGLTSNMVENVYIDSLQRVWVGTSEGLNLIRLDEKRLPSIRNYTLKHGLPSNEINQVEVYGKDIWVATAKGLIKLPGWELDTFSASPIINNILVNGKRFDAHKEEIAVFNYNQNTIQIDFLTIDFNQHGNIQYRYRLSPSQTDWVYTQNRRLDFSALNDNQYALEIQSQNRDGFWSKPTIFEFIILTPFWKAWWFFLSLFLLVGGTIFTWIYTREKRIQYEANLIREMAEAKQFALQSQMNPHFIFNCLASIQGFISTGEKNKAIRYLSKFSKLIRTSLEFMGNQSITLEEEISMVSNYLELEKMRHGAKFKYQLEISDNLDRFETTIPPLMVQPFIENAILHAFPDKKKNGILTIRYLEENEHLLAIVEDNGIGITASQQRKTQQEKVHNSLGMNIITRRLALKDNIVKDSLKIIELKDNAGNTIGTKVIINFGKSYA